MRDSNLWRRALDVDNRTVIDKVFYDEDEDVAVVRARTRKGARPRCGVCLSACGLYDRGEGCRRWRAVDVGVTRCVIEAEAPRVRCPTHGVVVAEVPWARHDVRHTRAFDDQAAWLATHTSKTALVLLLRIAWITVGAIIARVVDDAKADADPFDGLARIGIDEISYRRGHKYLTVVVDHDSGRLVWAAKGRDSKTLSKFFTALGETRCDQVKLVSADAAEWIANTVNEHCSNAVLCADPFHMVAWATEAVDEIRKQIWRDARTQGTTGAIRRLRGCKYALLKNPGNLTDNQATSLAQVAVVNKRLYRAYLLKEQFRLIFQLRGPQAFVALNDWLAWARRCQIPEFVALYHRIKKHRTTIEATLTHGLSNALVESTNTKLRLLTRIAYGFKSTDNLIAMCMLDRGGYCPNLPGR